MDTVVSSSQYSNNGCKVVENSMCNCCLAENVMLVNLQTCKHSSFLQSFYMMDSSKLFACLLCHSMLQKIEIFRKQIRSSSLVLKKHVPPSAQLNNLQQTVTTFITLMEDVSDITTNESEPFELPEMKIENESNFSDVENDIPLSIVKMKKIKKTESLRIDDKYTGDLSEEDLEERVKESKKKNIKIVQSLPIDDKYTDDLSGEDLEEERVKEPKKKKIKKVQSLPIDDKYTGKIMMLDMSREELEEERVTESKKKSYLELPFKCESCVKGFDHEKTLESHMEQKHKEKEGGILCDVCKTILGPAYFKEHTKRHYRRFHCMACGKRSQDMHGLARHYNMQHADLGPIDMQFTCTRCDYTTQSHREYRYHRATHGRKQQCSVCGNTYASRTSLRVHLLQVHKQSPRVFECTICNKSYSSKSGLYAHNASSHEGVMSFCEMCRTHYRTRSGLTHHLRTHSAHVAERDFKFTCAECGGKYMSKPQLQAHINWEHLKTIKYECDKCSKVFKSAVCLKNHIKYVHEKIRPPRDKICDYCGRGFTSISILRCHIRTHTGERPLRCALCPATFAHTAALYTHKKLVHKVRKCT